MAGPSIDSSNNANADQLPGNYSLNTLESNPIAPSESLPSVSSRLSSLLARLRGSETVVSKADDGTSGRGPIESIASADMADSPLESTTPAASAPLNYHHVTYAQSLSLVESLLQKPYAVSKIISLKTAQDEMEAKLWQERKGLEEKYENLVQNASESSSRWDPQDVQREMDAALLEFDRTRVLSAWDALIRDQQADLEKLGVPSMFTTKQPIERSRQQRVIRVIEDGLADAK